MLGSVHRSRRWPLPHSIDTSVSCVLERWKTILGPTCNLSDNCTSRVGIPKEVEATFHRGIKAMRGSNTVKCYRQAVHSVGTKVAGGYWVAVVAVPTQSKRLFDLKPVLSGRAPVPVPATAERAFSLLALGQDTALEAHLSSDPSGSAESNSLRTSFTPTPPRPLRCVSKYSWTCFSSQLRAVSPTPAPAAATPVSAGTSIGSCGS